MVFIKLFLVDEKTLIRFKMLINEAFLVVYCNLFRTVFSRKITHIPLRRLLAVISDEETVFTIFIISVADASELLKIANTIYLSTTCL